MVDKKYINITSGKIDFIPRNVPVIDELEGHYKNAQNQPLILNQINEYKSKSTYIHCVLNCDNLEEIEKTIILLMEHTNVFSSLTSACDYFSKLKLTKIIHNTSFSSIGIKEGGAPQETVKLEGNALSSIDKVLLKVTIESFLTFPKGDYLFFQNASDAARNKMKEIMPPIYEKIKLEKILPVNIPYQPSIKI